MNSTGMQTKIIRLLKRYGIDSMFFLDVGAKDNLNFIQKLSSITEIVGFEPNPKEIEILIKKYRHDSFKSLKLENYGLYEGVGKMTFNVTKHSSMSSLLDLDLDNYKKHFGYYRQFSGWENNVEVEKNIKIPCTTLDVYFKNRLKTIDFLKIDTQGSELKILKGAQKLLDEKKVCVLKVEVSTVPVYKNQEMFSDIDIYLREKGYVLVDFMTYREIYKPILLNSKSIDNHYAPCGDAIYVLDDQFLADGDRIKSGVILFWLGYYSLGLYLLKKSKMTKEDIDYLLNYRFARFKERFKQLLKNWLPPAILYLYRKFRFNIYFIL